MRSPLSFTSSSHPAGARADAVSAGVNLSNNLLTAPLGAPEAARLPAAVRETVAAVVNAIETMQARAETRPQTVHLDFDVGSEKLGLQLQVREGIVHTTFRTDSTELRHALSQEWLAVVPTLTTRDLAVATPVFSASTAGGQSAGSPFSGQGEQMPQRGQPSPESPVPAAPRTAGSVAVTTSTAPTAPLPTVTSSLLNAFA